MIDAKSLRKFVNSDHGWIATTLLQPAEILMAKAGSLLDLLLG